MQNYYPADVRDLSDEEIIRLMREIEDSGALDEDHYGEDSWESQASDRWSVLLGEQRRRNPPISGPGTGFIDAINKTTLEMINRSLVEEMFGVPKGWSSSS